MFFEFSKKYIILFFNPWKKNLKFHYVGGCYKNYNNIPCEYCNSIKAIRHFYELAYFLDS